MSNNSKAVMKSQRRKKIFAVEQFGGKCQLCGYDRCINALQFHHIDPSTKKASPSYLIMRASWDIAFEELKKCILVCANCHAELHYEDRDITVLAESQQTYTNTCVRCSNTFNTRYASQKYCSVSCTSFANRKVRKEPTKNDLKQLIADKVSWRKMGEMYGISDNGIRRWARKFGLIP
jgi:hypothetical protein